MKFKMLAFVCGLISTSVVGAKDVEISIDSGPVTKYELKELGISGDGAVIVNVLSKGTAPVDPTYSLVISQSTGGTISATPAPPYTCTGGNCPTVILSYTLSQDYAFNGWGGDCAKDSNQATCSLVMNSGRSVSAMFTSTATPPPLTDCKPEGTTLVDVPTSAQATAFPRTVYRPTPSTVHAFAFKTVPAGAMKTGRFTVNKLSSATSGKLIVISECRGDVSTTLTEEKTQGCVMFGSETATLGYVVNSSTKLKPLYYCNLKPNTQYYLNVIGRSGADSVNLCPDASVCSFDFEAQ